MSREGKNILAWVFKNFMDSLKPRKTSGDLMGKDYLGNKYYELKSTVHGRRSNRWFEPDGKDEDKFDEPLPAEWESWLRFRRKQPPTEEEIAENLALMETKKLKAAEIEEKFSKGKGSLSPPSPTSFPVLEDYETNPGSKKPRSN